MPPKKRAKPSGGDAGDGNLDPSKLKVAELREELEKRGLDSTGKKAELVARLEDALQAPAPSKKLKVEGDSVPSVDYSKMKLAELKKELEAQGLSTVGKKAKLVARLEGAVGSAGSEVAKVDTEKKTAKGKKKLKEEPVVEESDFSKAMRVLTTSDSKKSKKPKKHKVDDFYPRMGGGVEVVDDFDCMLNQTNIGHNNNKYYVIQLLKGTFGSAYTLWTRWGRVGEQGQSAIKLFGNLDQGIKEFKKKYSDKTKNKWEERENFVPVPGKYTLIEMEGEEDEEDDEESGGMDEPDVGLPSKVKACSLDKSTQELIKLIFNHDMFNSALKELEIDTKKMPLGKLSKTQIAKGFEALEAIEAALDASAPKSKLTELTSKFYTIIPHDFGRRIPPTIEDKETLQKKFDMLMVLGDIELAQGLQKEDKKKITAKEQEVLNQLDVQYQSLKADLKWLNESSHEYHLISKYIDQTSGGGGWYHKPKLMDVWRVDRHDVDKRFSQHSAITNRRLLWHGTNVAVVAAILKSGLRIMPHSGGRVGKGIYLASENSKSAAYVRSAPDGTGIMFLNEAALGKEHHITMDDHTLTAPPPGFDSVIAKGRTEPDPKLDTELILDGEKVVVPQGKPISTSLSTSSFSQSEYLVYKESQTRIRYMLRLKF